MAVVKKVHFKVIRFMTEAGKSFSIIICHNMLWAITWYWFLFIVRWWVLFVLN